MAIACLPLKPPSPLYFTENRFWACCLQWFFCRFSEHLPLARRCPDKVTIGVTASSPTCFHPETIPAIIGLLPAGWRWQDCWCCPSRDIYAGNWEWSHRDWPWFAREVFSPELLRWFAPALSYRNTFTTSCGFGDCMSCLGAPPPVFSPWQWLAVAGALGKVATKVEARHACFGSGLPSLYCHWRAFSAAKLCCSSRGWNQLGCSPSTLRFGIPSSGTWAFGNGRVRSRCSPFFVRQFFCCLRKQALKV